MPEPARLRVVAVVEETSESRSLVFEAPPDWTYRPGQFLTLRIPSDRTGSVARSYSLSSSPHVDDALQVTVKRAGYGSNWLCDNVVAGSEVDVLPPAGAFVPGSLDADVLLMAAGSGITPVMSIAKSVLAAGTGRIALIYANQHQDTVIFGAELRDLVARHPDRLLVVHWLESVQGLPTPATLRELARPFADRECFVCGPGGFMDTAEQALRDLEVPRPRTHIERFVSLKRNPFERKKRTPAPAPGPDTTPAKQPTTDPADSPTTGMAGQSTPGMAERPATDPADNATISLADSSATSPVKSPATGPAETATGPDSATNSPADPPSPDRPATTDGSTDATVELELDGKHHKLRWPRQQRLLDLLLANGVAAPYSCREGACSACACRIDRGEVKMIENSVLEQEDLDEGIILACQSLPITDRIHISYE